MTSLLRFKLASLALVKLVRASRDLVCARSATAVQMYGFRQSAEAARDSTATSGVAKSFENDVQVRQFPQVGQETHGSARFGLCPAGRESHNGRQ